MPGIARLGPDALAVDREQFAAILRSRSGQVKGALRDQTLISGVGNAYSDEILHAAQLSPFKMANKMDDDELVRLYDAMRATLSDALQRQDGRRRRRSRARSSRG